MNDKQLEALKTIWVMFGLTMLFMFGHAFLIQQDIGFVHLVIVVITGGFAVGSTAIISEKMSDMVADELTKRKHSSDDWLANMSEYDIAALRERLMDVDEPEIAYTIGDDGELVPRKSQR